MYRTGHLSPWFVLLLTLTLNACHDDPPQAVKSRKIADTAIVQMRLTDDAEHFLFTYLLADGSFQTVQEMKAIPDQARKQVIVIDTRLSPEKRQSSQVIYVADLTARRENGTYPCRPVSRFKFERDLLRSPGKSEGALPPECRDQAPSPGDHVILYVTSWCGVCKATARFMQNKGIPYVERDVEKNASAQRELACKALKTGTRLGGVPVLDIGGTLLLGFDRDDIVRLAGKLRPPAARD